MTAFFLLLAAFGVYVAGTRALGKWDGGWHRLERSYGLLLNEENGSETTSIRHGSILGVELRLWREPNTYSPEQSGRTRLRIEAVDTTAAWSCAFYNKHAAVPKVGTEVALDDTLLARHARCVPTAKYDPNDGLSEEVRLLLMHWFTPKSFQLQKHVVRWVRIGEGLVEFDAVGHLFSEKHVEQFLAEVIAFVFALRGTPIDGEPLDMLRSSKLPVARLVAGSQNNS
tara:strand:- start:59 stop:739 length:681 start_codon:yes stop_codon:yes gene_type:complete